MQKLLLASVAIAGLAIGGTSASAQDTIKIGMINV